MDSSHSFGWAGKILGLNFFITLIGFLDTHLLIPVLALYAVTLGAGVGVIGLIVGLYSITNALANLLGGRLVDRFGYKAPLIGGLIGDAIAMFGYVLCRLPWHLALVRAFHGSSGGLVGPATMSAVARHASSQTRGRAMGFYGMAIGLATLIGYGGGGVIASQLGYEFVFYTGALLLVIAIMLACFLPKGEGVASERASWGNDFQKVRELITRKNLSLSYWAIFAQYFAFGGIVTLLPLYVATFGMTAFHVGISLATFSLMFALTLLPAGFLSDRIGRLIPTILGLGLAVVSLVIITTVGTFSLLIMVMALYGIGYGLFFPSISALIADSTTSEEYGRATGIFHALITVGVATGAPLLGWTAQLLGIKVGLSSGGIALLIALSLALVTWLRERHSYSPR